MKSEMDARRSQFAIKLLPSLTDFAFLMPIVFLFGRMDGVKTLLGDCDTGWHIRTGEWILAHHAVPLARPFLLFEAGRRLVRVGVAVGRALGVAARARRAGGGGAGRHPAAVGDVHRCCSGWRGARPTPIVALVVTMVGGGGSSVHWLARPHLFTLLFLVLFYAALERVRDGRTRVGGVPYLVLLPVATILWTNLHGGFFVGILHDRRLRRAASC